jgi:hypothetical protein
MHNEQGTMNNEEYQQAAFVLAPLALHCSLCIVHCAFEAASRLL